MKGTLDEWIKEIVKLIDFVIVIIIIINIIIIVKVQI